MPPKTDTLSRAERTALRRLREIVKEQQRARNAAPVPPPPQPKPAGTL